MATRTQSATPAAAAAVDPQEGQILGQRNLLRNPKANQGAARWRKDGEASVEEGRFTVRHGGSFWQDVVLPPTLRSGVVVLVARVSSERVNPPWTRPNRAPFSGPFTGASEGGGFREMTCPSPVQPSRNPPWRNTRESRPGHPLFCGGGPDRTS